LLSESLIHRIRILIAKSFNDHELHIILLPFGGPDHTGKLHRLQRIRSSSLQCGHATEPGNVLCAAARAASQFSVSRNTYRDRERDAVNE